MAPLIQRHAIEASSNIVPFLMLALRAEYPSVVFDEQYLGSICVISFKSSQAEFKHIKTFTAGFVEGWNRRSRKEST